MGATGQERIPLIVVEKPRYTCEEHPEFGGNAPFQWGNHVRDKHGGISPKTGKPMNGKPQSVKPDSPTIPDEIGPDPDRGPVWAAKKDREIIQDSYLTVIDHLRAEQERIEKTIMELEDQLKKVRT